MPYDYNMTSTPTTQNTINYLHIIYEDQIHPANTYENPLLTTDIRFDLQGSRWSEHRDMTIYISPEGQADRKDYMGKEITELYAQFAGTATVICSERYADRPIPKTITVKYGDTLSIEGHGRFEVRQGHGNYPELILIGNILIGK
jgi:hypothetical protein